jgi:hypothetical protein
MRSVLAAFTDAASIAVLGFLAFRFALWATPCGSNLGDCFPLAPLIVICIVLAIVAYFLVSLLFWRTTFGQMLSGAEKRDED